MSDDIVIDCVGVGKTFRIPRSEERTLRGRILRPGSTSAHEEFRAIEQVDVAIRRGEFFGIVGRNGSGKSTLLKLLAGIYRLEEGTIDVEGSLAPFIELGVGFNEDLSARDNVFINGAILGMSRKQLRERYDAIVEFAELEQFMEMRLRNFSSGMLMRLAFAIAVQSGAEILLVDEVLAVGDGRFQRKCHEVFRERKRNGETVVFVSHDMNAVEMFCDRVLLLEQGEQIAVGPPAQVVPKYHELNRLATTLVRYEPDADADAAHPVLVRDFSITDPEGAPIEIWEADELLTVEVTIDSSIDLESVVAVRVLVMNDGGGLVGAVVGKVDSLRANTPVAFRFSIENILNPGPHVFEVEVHARFEDGARQVASSRRQQVIAAADHEVGVVRLPYEVEIHEVETTS